MSRRELSTPEQWETMYSRGKDRRHWPNPEERCSAYELERVYRRLLPRGPGARLLEMGCGGSKWLPYFNLAMGFDVVGIDYTPTGCAAARETLERAGASGRVEQRDFLEENADLVGGFDVVVSYGVVEHFEDTAAIVATFCRYLKPRGMVVTYVPNFAGWVGRFLKAMNRPLYDTHHIFRLDHLVRAHDVSGAEILYARYHEFMDFTVLPVDQLPLPAALVLKNGFQAINRVRGFVYRRTEQDVQSKRLCAAMLVVARMRG